MTPLDFNGRTHMCVHHQNFPPPFSTGTKSPEELRQEGWINERGYQQILVWKRVCGLLVMEPSKCSSCLHLRTVGYKDGIPGLFSIDRASFVPFIDKTTLELMAHRGK